MPNQNERMRATSWPTAMALFLAVLGAGCEGDLARLMQRDPDSARSEVPVIDRTSREERVPLEERLGKLEADLRSRLEKFSQEKEEEAQGLSRSQAGLSTRLDELIEQTRLAQGQVEEIGHRIFDLNKRVDALGSQVGQFGRRLDVFEKQLGQAVASAQEAKVMSQTAATAVQGATDLAQQAAAASQQTAQGVTDALRQMADQTNVALQQVSATAQLALTEARKAGTARQSAQPGAQPVAAIVKLPSPISTSPPAPATPRSPVPTLTTKATPSAVSPEELYKNALEDYTKRKYDLAIDGFRTYIILYPNTSLLPNARYWLGESFYSLKNYSLAVKQFELFLTEYPESPKVPSAMLKQGYAYLEMGDAPQGRAVLKDLIKRFPRKPEARSAKSRLSKAKKGPRSRPGAKGLPKRIP